MQIDELIKGAILEKNTSKKEAYRALKSEIVKARTMTKQPVNEFDILRKLIKQREDSALIYRSHNREDLAEVEESQLHYLKELMPPAPTEDELEEFIVTSFPNGYSNKEMGMVINSVKQTFPIAAGEIIAKLVKNHIQ